MCRLLLIWALELACVCVLAYDSFSKVFSVSGAPEVIRNSGLAVRRVNQIVFDVAEVVSTMEARSTIYLTEFNCF